MSKTLEALTKKAKELEAKGAMRTKHEDRELANTKIKLQAAGKG